MEKIRLQKYLADAGIMSRRAAEEEIKNGNVSVNGHVAELGSKIDPRNDVVAYRGKRIRYEKKEYTYIMMNKPRGYLCSTTDDRGRKCVTDLLDGVNARVYPVGRLDLVSEGILLLTDDGELKNRLTHPKHAIGKVYRVKVAGKVSDEQMEILTSELVIDGYKIKPVVVNVSSEDESGTVPEPECRGSVCRRIGGGKAAVGDGGTARRGDRSGNDRTGRNGTWLCALCSE